MHMHNNNSDRLQLLVKFLVADSQQQQCHTFGQILSCNFIFVPLAFKPPPRIFVPYFICFSTLRGCIKNTRFLAYNKCFVVLLS